MHVTYFVPWLTIGAEFLLKYAKDPVTHKCYLSLTRDGRPIKTQRSIFSECFYTLAMSELARATGDQKYKVVISF